MWVSDEICAPIALHAHAMKDSMIPTHTPQIKPGHVKIFPHASPVNKILSVTRLMMMLSLIAKKVLDPLLTFVTAKPDMNLLQILSHVLTSTSVVIQMQVLIQLTTAISLQIVPMILLVLIHVLVLSIILPILLMVTEEVLMVAEILTNVLLMQSVAMVSSV